MTETSSTSSSPASLRTKVLIASAWAVVTRWGGRLLGLISVAVLARLLTPEDFGVIAAVMAILAVVDAVTLLGIDWALIQNHEDDQKLYDTAWTIRLIKNLLVAVLLLVSSPLAAQYTDDSRVAPVMWVIAAGILIQGTENIGVVQFRKELDFRKEFLFLTLPKVLTVGLSIVAAIVLRSYWAIVIGIVGRQLIQTLASYLMHPMRPRLSLSRFEQIWSFSRWMVLFNIGDRLFENVDRLFLAGQIEKERLAYFTVGGGVTSSVTQELILPVNSVLMASFAKLKHEQQRLRDAYIKSAGVMIALALPVTVGVSSLSEELTLVLLGDQWLAAAPIMSAMALALLFFILADMTNSLMLMVGMVKRAALLATFFATTYIAALYPVFASYGIFGLIVLKGSLGFLRFLWQTKISFDYLDAPLSALWGIMQRPLLATLTMYLAVDNVPDAVMPPSLALLALLALLLKTGLGAIVFAASLLSIWWLSGRPDGFERFLLEALNKKLPAKWRFALPKT